MTRRTYGQFCATARTLDVVGERWTLLVIRELITGPRRFGDLLDGLPGIGTGLLSARLKHLEAEGVVEKVTLPAPARAPAYALTESGRDLEPAVRALARWGLKWSAPERAEDEAFRAGWAVLGMSSTFDPEAAAGLHAVYEFRVGDDVFHARVDDGMLETRHGPAERPDLTITTTDDTFADLWGGRTTLAEAVRKGDASWSGDKAALPGLRALVTGAR